MNDSINNKKYKFDLFISYSSSDTSRKVSQNGREVEINPIEILKQQLELHRHPETKRRFRVCTYEEDFDLAETVKEAIEEQLDKSKGILVVGTEQAIDSKYVQYEVSCFTELISREGEARVAIPGILDVHPAVVFSKLFPSQDIVGVNLAIGSIKSVKDYTKQIRNEANKIVAKIWGLPLEIVYDRFEKDRLFLKNVMLKVGEGLLFIVLPIVLGWNYWISTDRYQLQRTLEDSPIVQTAEGAISDKTERLLKDWIEITLNCSDHKTVFAKINGISDKSNIYQSSSVKVSLYSSLAQELLVRGDTVLANNILDTIYYQVNNEEVIRNSHQYFVGRLVVLRLAISLKDTIKIKQLSDGIINASNENPEGFLIEDLLTGVELFTELRDTAQALIFFNRALAQVPNLTRRLPSSTEKRIYKIQFQSLNSNIAEVIETGKFLVPYTDNIGRHSTKVDRKIRTLVSTLTELSIPFDSLITTAELIEHDNSRDGVIVSVLKAYEGKMTIDFNRIEKISPLISNPVGEVEYLLFLSRVYNDNDYGYKSLALLDSARSIALNPAIKILAHSDLIVGNTRVGQSKNIPKISPDANLLQIVANQFREFGDTSKSKDLLVEAQANINKEWSSQSIITLLASVGHELLLIGEDSLAMLSITHADSIATNSARLSNDRGAVFDIMYPLITHGYYSDAYELLEARDEKSIVIDVLCSLIDRLIEENREVECKNVVCKLSTVLESSSEDTEKGLSDANSNDGWLSVSKGHSFLRDFKSARTYSNRISSSSKKLEACNLILERLCD